MSGEPVARERVLVRTLVELADTLVDDFDVVELFARLTDRCVETLAVAQAGLMLTAPRGGLGVVASSSDEIRVLELFELQTDEGPCPDCFRTGRQVDGRDLSGEDHGWPRFAPRAVEAGYLSVHALPMHLRDRTIGALNLFLHDRGGLDDEDLAAAQAFADVATIGILQHQSAVDSHALNAQLNRALSSRIVIEQAKGMISERTGTDMETAFSRLRSHARNHNLLLADVARSVVDGSLSSIRLDALRPRSAASRSPDRETPQP